MTNNMKRCVYITVAAPPVIEMTLENILHHVRRNPTVNSLESKKQLSCPWVWDWEGIQQTERMQQVLLVCHATTCAHARHSK